MDVVSYMGVTTTHFTRTNTACRCLSHHTYNTKGELLVKMSFANLLCYPSKTHRSDDVFINETIMQLGSSTL